MWLVWRVPLRRGRERIMRSQRYLRCSSRPRASSDMRRWTYSTRSRLRSGSIVSGDPTHDVVHDSRQVNLATPD